MSEPIAFLLTWTCYGAWLHGDDRGSIDDDHRMPKTPHAPSDELRHEIMKSRMRSTAVVLSQDDRQAVDSVIRQHCQIRKWWLGACNVRSNHVHCVVGAQKVRPEEIVRQLKSWSTRSLRAKSPDRFAGSVWTRHASTRYLWKQDEVDSAVYYVSEGQDMASRWDRPTSQ